MITYYEKPNGKLTKDSTKGYKEYLSPLSLDGTLLPNHKNLHLVADITQKYHNLTIDATTQKYEPDTVKIQEDVNLIRVTEIDSRLDEIDKLTIRSLRSINRGRGTPTDDTKMTELDDEAEALRIERATLT